MSDKWTANDIPDQSGRVVVVTGANSGLGLATSRELARRGARLIMACRDPQRGERALSEVRAKAPQADVRLAALDLGDLSSVRAFAEAFAVEQDGLDVLINNAGIMAVPRATTADGFESQLGTNHLGHFALTGLLLPSLLDRPHSRVVTVSSSAHRMGKIDFDDLQRERRYRRWPAYGQSKLANLLFTFELERRATAAGLELRAMAAHPGYAATNLQTAGKASLLDRVYAPIGNLLIAQSADHGALPSLYAATVPDLPGGSFVGPDGFMEARGHPKLVQANGSAYDPDTARRLWEVSEQLTGVHYAFESTAQSASTCGRKDDVTSLLAAVAFDLDGVLIDSEQLWDVTRRALVSEHGGQWREQATRDMQGMSAPEWSRYLQEQLGADLEPEEINTAVVMRLREVYREHLPLLPRAVDAVRAVAAHWPLALASSSNRELIEFVLEQAGLADAFAVIVSSEEVARGKPAPDVYLAAAERLGVDSSDCVAVEDSSNGLRAAAAAGMAVVAVPNTEFPPEPDALALAAVVIDSISELTPDTIEQAARAVRER